MRVWRAKYPIRAMFTALRNNAKRRGKEFSLKFEEWKNFVLENNLLECRGKESHSLTVDRIDPTLGYRIDNIRPLTLVENSARGDDPF